MNERRIDRKDALFLIQLLASSLSAIVSISAIRKILSEEYKKNPNFFRSANAKKIYIALVALVFLGLGVLYYINRIANKEDEQQGWNN